MLPKWEHFFICRMHDGIPCIQNLHFFTTWVWSRKGNGKLCALVQPSMYKSDIWNCTIIQKEFFYAKANLCLWTSPSNEPRISPRCKCQMWNWPNTFNGVALNVTGNLLIMWGSYLTAWMNVKAKYLRNFFSPAAHLATWMPR